jgi:hypothetical protein
MADPAIRQRLQSPHSKRRVTDATDASTVPVASANAVQTCRSAAGLAIAKMLITRKINGQFANLELLNANTRPLTNALDAVEDAETLDRVRLAESMAADSYWAAWRAVEVNFVKADLPRVPAHWRRFQQRSSPIANGPRLAVDPPNCIVNYLAGVLEAATRVVCLAIGMDESLAIIHADAPARSSMIFDLCEPARPDIERFTIQLLERHTFSRRDFVELPSGACRVMPPIRDFLAATGPAWREWSPHTWRKPPGSSPSTHAYPNRQPSSPTHADAPHATRPRARTARHDRVLHASAWTAAPRSPATASDVSHVTTQRHSATTPNTPERKPRTGLKPASTRAKMRPSENASPRRSANAPRPERLSQPASADIQASSTA